MTSRGKGRNRNTYTAIKKRIFSADEYSMAGTIGQEEMSSCPIVLAIKEIPPYIFQEASTYVLFSHIIKGQPHNMTLLKKLIDKKCQLIDYECIMDDKGRRLTAFGRFAGLAGMIDTLWALGRRVQGRESIHSFLECCWLTNIMISKEIQEVSQEIGSEIKKEGLLDQLTPLVCGFAGYGKVSQGAQEIFDILPVKDLSPRELPNLIDRKDFPLK